MANNAADHPSLVVAGKYDRLNRQLIAAALRAGITEADIDAAAEDFYYQDLDDAAAEAAIQRRLPAGLVHVPMNLGSLHPAPEQFDLF